jgi:hypothetical protein
MSIILILPVANIIALFGFAIGKQNAQLTDNIIGNNK